MRFITLDVEAPYSTADKYSLSHPDMTYERYIRDDRFRVNGLGYQIDNGETHYVYGEENIRRKLEELFPPGNTNVMICHNAKFDGAVVAWFYGVRAARYYCTEAMSRSLWNQSSASLEELAKRCFPKDKSVRKSHELKDFDGILRELTDDEQAVLGPYCANDVSVTFRCFCQMWKWFPTDSLGILDVSLKMFIDPGFQVDRPRVRTYLRGLEREVETLAAASATHLEPLLTEFRMGEKKRQKLTTTELAKKFLASNDWFAKWILSKGITLEKVPSPTPTNPDNMKWPLAKDAPEFIDIQTDYPEHRAVWDARLAVKSTIERTRCVRMLDHSTPSHINPDCKLPLALNFAAAHTQRFGGTNKLNALNFKRGSELRKSLVAPHGYLIGVADLSNIEARKLAWVAGEHTIIQAFRDKRDLYCEFAAEVFRKAINKDDNPTERFVGKVCELGLGYQMGPPTLRRTLAVGAMGGPRLYFSLTECQAFVALFRAKHPHTKQLWAFMQQMLVAMCMKGTHEQFHCLTFEYQRIRLPNGHYLNYPGLKAEEDAERGGYTFSYWNGKYRTSIYGGKLVENIIQALAQALLWAQMLKTQDFLATIGGRILLQVHDEIVMLLREREAQEALKEVLGMMRQGTDWTDNDLILDAEGAVDYNYSK